MHMLDLSNNRANMAYVGNTPWHNLGTELQEGVPLDEWKIAAGLNWQIEKAPVTFKPAAPEGSVSAPLEFPDKAVLYRSDTKTALSIMSDSRYHIVQPGEIIDFYADLVANSQYDLETAGSLKGGAVVWALAKAREGLSIMGQDVIKPYLLLSTSCDGTMSTVAELTTVRVVCNNTLTLAVGNNGANATIRVPHVAKLNHDAIKRDLFEQQALLEEFGNGAEAMANRQVGKAEAVNYFVDLYKKVDPETQKLENEKQLEKIVNALMEHWLAGPGSDLRSSKGTAWGLVNAVTRYEDFDSPARSEETRFRRNQYGKGRDKKVQAFNAGLTLAA